MPASSANLGPGFDSLAVALAIYLRVYIYLDDDAEPQRDQLDLLGGADLIALGMRRVAEEFGRPLPPRRIRAESQIPVARGLGSSAAAIVAGLQAGAVLLSDSVMGNDDLIAIGGAIEGHADNVSAAVLGGVTAAIGTARGYRAVCLATDLPWKPVLFVPESAAFTHHARGVLPPNVPLGDASANIGRAAMLVHAFQNADATLLGDAMEDRLHQPYRAELFPHLQPIIRESRNAGAAGACLSGAGPAVLALVPEGCVEAVRQAIANTARDLEIAGDVRTPEIDRKGATVCFEGVHLD
ncbi:homoserine kinase [soil metagenome]